MNKLALKPVGKFSRDKGVRAERSIARLLGGKRTGYAGTDNPDVTTPFALISVKDEKTPISLNECLTELCKLESQDKTRHHYVAVKVNHQVLIIERIEQHVLDHVGDMPDHV